jgi:predicted DNA-binding protein
MNNFLAKNMKRGRPLTENKQLIHLKITPAMKDRLDSLARERGETKSAVIRDFIRRGLASEVA